MSDENQKRIDRLKVYQGDDRVVGSAELRKELDTQKPNPVRFESGWPDLEKYINGLEGGEMIGITGLPKSGKTLLAQNLTLHALQQGIMSIWFSYELSIRQFLARMPADKDFFTPKIMIPHNMTWIADRILESKLKYNTRLVVIDHLHYLVDLERKGGNISVDIGAIIRKLHRWAISMNVVIILLCHATKAQGIGGVQRELGAGDARDSGMISAEVDSMWAVMRVHEGIRDMNYVENGVVVKVCHHRRTGILDKKVFLRKPKQDDIRLAQCGYKFQNWQDEPKFFKDFNEPKDGGDGDDIVPF